MKKYIITILLILTGVILCNTQQATASEEIASISETSTAETDSYMIDFYPWEGDYDYDFYLQGIYFSADGKNDVVI